MRTRVLLRKGDEITVFYYELWVATVREHFHIHWSEIVRENRSDHPPIQTFWFSLNRIFLNI